MIKLVGYWDNNLIASEQLDFSKAQFGTRTIGNSNPSPSPVHSLAVQDEEMFALAGSDVSYISFLC